MATKGGQDVEMMVKSLHLFQEDLMRADKSSHGVAKNFTELAWQIKYGQKNLHDYLGEGIKLRGMFKEIASAVASKPEQIKSQISVWQDAVSQASHMLQTEELKLANLRKNASKKNREAALTQVSAAHQLLDEQQSNLTLEKHRLELTERVHAITGKTLAIEFMMGKGFVDAIRRSGEMNESLMAANSLTSTRKDMTDQVWQVQAKTGASMQNMLAASRALANVWPKMRNDFQSTLEVMVEMEEGLGVSYENSAQLARVFEISLKVPVREVADQIAIIANSTSLTADEATRFATEIGKAMRTLGSGGQQAKEVSSYVTTMAARMNDVGGSAEDVVNIFKEMTKGTSESIMMQSLAGISGPGQAGTSKMFQGMDQRIRSMVTAEKTTRAYTVQLEVASQMLHMSTDTIARWNDMMQAANRPLDERTTLENRWRDQIQNANKAIGRLRESFIALIQQAFVPLMPIVTGLFGTLAKIVSFLASNKYAAMTATAVLIAGITYSIRSLYRLATALWHVTIAAGAAAKAEMLRNDQQMLMGFMGGKGGSIGNLFPTFAKNFTSLNGLKTLFTSPTPWMAMAKTYPLLAIALAGAIGYGIGRLIDPLMDKLGAWSALLFPIPYLTKQIAEYLGKLSGAHGVASTEWKYTGKGGDKPVWYWMAEIKKALIEGRKDDASRIYREGQHHLSGLHTARGLEGYENAYIKAEAEAREVVALRTVTSGEKEASKNDKQLIDLSSQLVKLTDIDIQKAQDRENQRKLVEERNWQENMIRDMKRSAQFRLQPNSSMPSKVVLTPGGLSILVDTY